MIAIAAINWSAGAGLKRYLGLFAAFAAGDRVHLTYCGRRKGRDSFLFYGRPFRPFGSPGSTASGTPLGRMVMSLGSKSLLFFNREDVSSAAVKANQ